jgi:hypothetical protein
MKHASTRAVFNYWNERRVNRPAPGRADIDPAAIRHALGDTFMLSADFVDQLRFRLAGTRVCALFCREIKGEILADLWAEKSRKAIEDILSIVTTETAGAVTGLTGHAEDGATADLEMLLLPLARIGQARTGLMGVLAPTTPAYWIGEKPIVEIELNTVRHLGSQADNLAAPLLAPSTEGGELRHGFTVYTGGRVETTSERAS